MTEKEAITLLRSSSREDQKMAGKSKTKSPSKRMTVVLKLLAGSRDGVTEYFFKVVHGVNRRTLDTLVTAGLASATVEHLKQGFDVTRFHITQAGRDTLGRNSKRIAP